MGPTAKGRAGEEGGKREEKGKGRNRRRSERKGRKGRG